jgi:soluble lytic murein transglycosylase-like protein
MASRRAASIPLGGALQLADFQGKPAPLTTLICLCCCLAIWLTSSISSKPVGEGTNPDQVRAAERIEPDRPASAASPPNLVWLLFSELSHCRRSLPEHARWRIAGAIHDQSRRYGYDPLFVLAMIVVESTCSPSARGPKGALGLIQVKPETARAISREAGMTWSGAAMLIRPTVNLQLGLHYLSTLENRLNDPYLALAAYNMGPTRIAGMGRPQARRTRYVRKVLAQYDELLRRDAARAVASLTVD